MNQAHFVANNSMYPGPEPRYRICLVPIADLGDGQVRVAVVSCSENPILESFIPGYVGTGTGPLPVGAPVPFGAHPLTSAQLPSSLPPAPGQLIRASPAQLHASPLLASTALHGRSDLPSDAVLRPPPPKSAGPPDSSIDLKSGRLRRTDASIVRAGDSARPTDTFQMAYTGRRPAQRPPQPTTPASGPPEPPRPRATTGRTVVPRGVVGAGGRGQGRSRPNSGCPGISGALSDDDEINDTAMRISEMTRDIRLSKQ